jgi:hypothetical protein
VAPLLRGGDNVIALKLIDLCSDAQTLPFRAVLQYTAHEVSGA